MKEKYAKYLPHSSGRYAAKRFRKAQCPIVERVTNSMMMHGRNNGKKLLTVRIVKHAFEIIHLLTGEVRQRFSTDLLMPGCLWSGLECKCCIKNGQTISKMLGIFISFLESSADPGERHHQQWSS